MSFENRRKSLGTITLDMSATNVTSAFANFGSAVSLSDNYGVADQFEVVNPSAIPVEFEIVKSAAPQSTQVIPCAFGLGREQVGVPVANGDQFKVKSLGASITTGILVINMFRAV